MKEYFLVKDKKPTSEIVCIMGDPRNPTHAVEAAKAVAELIQTITEAEVPVCVPSEAKGAEVSFRIAVAGDGLTDADGLVGDAFSVTVDEGNVKILAGNGAGLWNAVAYFSCAVLGYDPRTGDEPEKADSLKLPKSLAYSFEGNPDPVPLPEVIPEGAFKVSMVGDTYYEQMLRHTAFTYNDNPVPCLFSGDYHESMIRKAVAEHRLIWNVTGECHCDSCNQHKNETGEGSPVFCHCPACKAAAEKEGTICGAYFELVREAAKRLARLEPDAYLTIAATGVTLDPPKNYLGDNVCVIVADRTLVSSYPVSEDSACAKNAEFARKLLKWRKLCGRLYVIDFTSDYYFFPATFPNFGIMRQNVAFYSRAGADGLFLQFDRMQSELEFSEVRTVLAEALVARPLMSDEEYDERLQSALVHFYGKTAAPEIRRYIDRFTELAVDGKEFGTSSTPGEILPVMKENGKADLSFAKEAFKIWDTVHPHPVKLAQNNLFICRRLFSEYQSRAVCRSKVQFTEWLMGAVSINERGRVIEELFAD